MTRSAYIPPHQRYPMHTYNAPILRRTPWQERVVAAVCIVGFVVTSIVGLIGIALMLWLLTQGLVALGRVVERLLS